MLDPELLVRLAAQPERNAPDVNVALAEQGSVSVLEALANSRAVAADALRAVARRVVEEAPLLESQFRLEHGLQDDEPCSVLLQLQRALVAHPNAPPDVRDALLEQWAHDPFFVLAAASHPRATRGAVERASDWPARAPVLERLWLALLPAEALGPLEGDEWAQDPDPRRREVAARLLRDPVRLARLARDEARQVRRAVASNVHAGAERARLAAEDPAVEVRARAAATLGEHGGPVSVESARFAAALRAMQDGGALSADVAGALGASGHALDEEGAMWAARLLPRDRVIPLVAAVVDGAGEPDAGLAVGVGLRPPADERLGGEEDHRELVAEVSKALSSAASRFGGLTGKARLAAWVAEGLFRSRVAPLGDFLRDLDAGPIAADPLVLGLGLRSPEILAATCDAAEREGLVPGALLERAWSCPTIPDAQMERLARRVSRGRPRGRDLPDDEVDLDPTRRPAGALERVVLAACRTVTFSPRTALAAVALDSRRVRYVLTAMPAWRGRLSGAMLGRVLRQNAGALAAGPAEARFRGEQMRGWTERMLNDIELAIAFAIGHITIDALVERLDSGRHRLLDGSGLAAAAEARAAIAGSPTIRVLVEWSARERTRDAAALAVWLLLESFDRARSATRIASAIDSLETGGADAAPVIEALAALERRSPGRLTTMVAQTPRGRALVASGLARAYRAVGGLRDERAASDHGKPS